MSTTAEGSKFSPPRSLMNLENAEEVWTIIIKRYPKAAPLLCEMEAVLEQAENLLEQLKSPTDLGIDVLSTEESLYENFNESEGTVSEIINSCEDSISKNVDSSTLSESEIQECTFHYPDSTELVFTAEESNKAPFNIEDQKTVSNSSCAMYSIGEMESFCDKVPENTKEYLKKLDYHSDEPFETCSSNLGLITNSPSIVKLTIKENKSSRPSSAPRNREKNTEITQLSRPQEIRQDVIKSDKKATPILIKSPRQCAHETEESIPHFKKVVHTLKRKEESNRIVKNVEYLKTDEGSQEKLEELTEIFRIKVTDTESIDAWDKVVGNSSKSNENAIQTNFRKLADDEKMLFDKFSKKQDVVSLKSTKNPLAVDTNMKTNSMEERYKKDRQKTETQECGDTSNLSKCKSPVVILEQYANTCNKPVEYLINEERKGKIEITCSFSNYKALSCGKTQDVVKNEAAARMLHMLATSQMEKNIADLQEFSRQQILEITKLNKGDSFMPMLARRIIMVKLYTFCLEQNLPEPKYDVTHDEQYGFSSKCKVLNYIGIGTGRTDGQAKEKAAEDFCKKHFSALKSEPKSH